MNVPSVIFRRNNQSRWSFQLFTSGNTAYLGGSVPPHEDKFLSTYMVVFEANYKQKHYKQLWHTHIQTHTHTHTHTHKSLMCGITKPIL